MSFERETYNAECNIYWKGGVKYNAECNMVSFGEKKSTTLHAICVTLRACSIHSHSGLLVSVGTLSNLGL